MNDGHALGDFKVRILTSRPANADAVDAGRKQKVDEPIEGGLVEPAVVVDWRSNGSKQSGYFHSFQLRSS